MVTLLVISRLFSYIDTLVCDISDDSSASGTENNRSLPYIVNSIKILIRQSSKSILKVRNVGYCK